MCRNLLVICCLLALTAAGCGKRPDPFGHQVSRAGDASLRGQELLSEGELRRAEKAFERSLAINRGIDHPGGAAEQLNNLAAVALTRGDLAAATDLFQQALAINRDLGDAGAAAINLANLATVAYRAGDLAAAQHRLEEARTMAGRSGSVRVMVQVLCQMAGMALDRGDLGAAAQLLEEARPAMRGVQVRGSWNYQQGRLALARGDSAGALAFFREALRNDRAILNRTAMAADLMGLGNAWEAQGDFSQAFFYFSRACQLYATLRSRDQARLSVEALRRVNAAGGLGRSLQPYEQLLEPPWSDPACPPPPEAGPREKGPTPSTPPKPAGPEL